MTEENMKEMGLDASQRLRLKVEHTFATRRECQQRVLEAYRIYRLEVETSERCSQNGCGLVATSNCRECQAFLCPIHRQTIRKEEKSGDSTIVVEVPACSKCKEEYEKRNEDCGLCQTACVFGSLSLLLILYIGTSELVKII